MMIVCYYLAEGVVVVDSIIYIYAQLLIADAAVCSTSVMHGVHSTAVTAST
jgi:hypothetical protein